MIKFSLCMIVKNEEDVLERCLNSISNLASEIIIVDTGSHDQTKKIARLFTNKIYDFSWCDDFSMARNFAFSKATLPYMMWLDADDVIEKVDYEKLKKFLNTDDLDFDIVMMKYQTGFDAQGNVTFSYYRERLVKNNKQNRFQGFLHEVIPLHGKILYQDIAVTHKKLHVQDSDRNLRILEKQHTLHGLNPREQYYYARELFYHAKYQPAIDMFTTFLNGKQGWVENNIDACRIRGHCFQRLQMLSEAFASYCESFYYATPRSEVLCDIAFHFFQQHSYQEAIFWYELAAKQTPDDTTGAFIEKDCYDFIPYLQLCVCYDRLKDRKKAIYYNELAGFIKPGNEQYLYNRNYFRKNEDIDQ